MLIYKYVEEQLSSHPGCQEVSRCHTKSESEDSVACRRWSKWGNPPWFWNPGQTPPEVQNRSISGPIKRTDVLQFFLQKTKHTIVLKVIATKVDKSLEIDLWISIYTPLMTVEIQGRPVSNRLIYPATLVCMVFEDCPYNSAITLYTIRHTWKLPTSEPIWSSPKKETYLFKTWTLTKKDVLNYMM